MEGASRTKSLATKLLGFLTVIGLAVPASFFVWLVTLDRQGTVALSHVEKGQPRDRNRSEIDHI